MKISTALLCSLLTTWAAAPTPLLASEQTAFELIKEGNRYIGEQSHDKVVQIRSEKSVGSLEPNVWYVVYYDPTATLKATEVKFGAGKMMAVKRPLRLLEPITGGSTPMDRDKLKIDSNQATKIAMDEPLLKNLKITAVQLKLQRTDDALFSEGKGSAAWSVKLWAAKLHNPNKDVDIGEVWLSANDGKVFKSDLHINRVD